VISDYYDVNILVVGLNKLSLFNSFWLYFINLLFTADFISISVSIPKSGHFLDAFVSYIGIIQAFIFYLFLSYFN
jgi:hypothetical protein